MGHVSDVLRMLASGQSNKQIVLGISLSAVAPRISEIS